MHGVSDKQKVKHIGIRSGLSAENGCPQFIPGGGVVGTLKERCRGKK